MTDVNGNTSTCSAVVTVQDNVFPEARCKPVTIQLSAGTSPSGTTGGGAASITTGDIDNNSTDNCAIATYALDEYDFDCSEVGANTVVLSVTDVNGNTSTCSATVTVQDNVAPEARCKNIAIALDATGSASITASQVNNNSTDNCAIASMTVTPSTFNCTNTGTNTVVLRVTDVNGNSSTCSSVVTVTGGPLYNYVMLATDKIHLHNSIVQSGGVGMMTANGNIDLHQYTMVTAPGTFVQGLVININSGSMVTTQINSVAVAPLPSFETNPYTSNNNISVGQNQTVTLTDSIYNEIKIDKYGTVIFTQPVVNIRKIESKEFAVIKFTQCTKIRLKEHLHMKRNTQFNPDGLGVTAVG